MALVSCAMSYPSAPYTPFHVPDVVTSLSHERVIVSEFVDGRCFEELKLLPQEERDRIGEMIFRFYFGSMYRHHQFSGDPHPGNSLLLGDGRMAFLDFGLFKRIRPDIAEYELQSQRLGIERRAVPLLESSISPYLYLHSATPAFEYPRRNLPDTVHWIGPLLPETGDQPSPAWWPELDGDRPVVLVTQGTVATDDGDLIRPTLQALADEPGKDLALNRDGPPRRDQVESRALDHVGPGVDLIGVDL